VDVVLVEPGAVSIVRELDLELELILAYGHPADRAEGADARTSPGTIRSAGREFSGFDRRSGLLAQFLFVHLADSYRRRAVSTEGLAKPDATGRRRARHESRW